MNHAMKPIVITLYYDIGSLYSYVALSILKRYEHTYWAKQVKIALEPVLVGGIFKATGNSAPMTLPAKRLYGVKDMQYLSSYTGIKFAIPTEIPANTLKVMRLLTAIKLKYPSYLIHATQGLFKAYWCLGVSMQSDEQLMNFIMAELNLDEVKVRHLMSESTGTAVKRELREKTEKAIELGLFGVPTMTVETANFPSGYLEDVGGVDDSKHQLFFGSDRLPVMAHLLNLPWYGPLREVGEAFTKAQSKM